MLTGINRKEINRIRSADATRPGPSSFSRNVAASLVSIWMTDPGATDRGGVEPAMRDVLFVALR